MKLELLVVPLILAASTLASFVNNPIDWIKPVAGAMLAKVGITRHYFKVYSARVPAIVHSGSDVIHGSDDFLPDDIGSNKNWVYVGRPSRSFVPSQPKHPGIISISSGTTTSVNELVGPQVCSPGIAQCVARFVVSFDAPFTATGGFDGEWYVGIAAPDGRGNVYAGAMLNYAPGFAEHPGTELLPGSYTSRSSETYTPTTFRMAPNTWYDLIISWTPKVIKYYAALYGQTPTLIARNTTNISTAPQYLVIGNNRYINGFPSVTLSLDKVEWYYTTSQGMADLAENMLKLYSKQAVEAAQPAEQHIALATTYNSQ
jgi:hypothetical protein